MSNRAQQIIRSELDDYLSALERRVRELEERVRALEGIAEKHRVLETRVARLDDDLEGVTRAAEGPAASAHQSGFRFRAVKPR